MILLNPTYESMRAQLSNPAQLMAHGKPIHRGRNELCLVTVDGILLCIKRYGVSNRFKQFIYRYLRAPKGLRAWQNTIKLREVGLDSPEPIAYTQYNSLWGLRDSYYICRYADGQTLYHWGDCDVENIKKDIVALAHFAARMHEAGLLMLDFTPGNILRTKEGFTLVDTNRMRQGRISVRQGLKNMAGLWLQPQAAELLARTYVSARGEKQLDGYSVLYAQYRRSFWLRFVHRHHLQDVIVHHDLDGNQYSYHFNSTIR